MTVGPDPASAENPTWARLEDQIAWYDRKSQDAQRRYKRVKVVQLVAAASVPPLAGLRAPAAVVSVMASVVVVLEGLQHLYQWNENWIAYRSTCEDLKHEEYLFLARAGPYANVPNPSVLLAERVEGAVSKEHAKWASTQRQTTRKEKEGDGDGALPPAVAG